MSEQESHVTETREPRTYAYVRTREAETLPPPPSQIGVRGWLWENVFSSMANFSSITAGIQSLLMTAMTLGVLYFGVTTIWELVKFSFIDAVWTAPEGIKRDACTTTSQGGSLPATWFGACWPFVQAKFDQFIYGRYPVEHLWRVNLVFLAGAIGLVWLALENAPWRKWVGAIMLLVYPIFSFILLTGANLEAGSSFWLYWPALTAVLLGLGIAGVRGLGGELLSAFSGVFLGFGALFAYVTIAALFGTIDYGLETVETNLWGGLLVTLVVALTGIIASLPIGVVLALGRRSRLPVFRILSTVFIEFWRGVPLITVLFMSSVMLPLFLPAEMDFNKLLRALIGVMFFSAAYQAEVVRGGLQAIPSGQYEAARALGLSYGGMMQLIVLPQALTLVIPGIVNTFIGLFKDTTLVLIIGLFDLLGQVQSSFTDASWSSPVQAPTGYLVVAVIFWAFCFGMSRYSMYMERKLSRGHKR